MVMAPLLVTKVNCARAATGSNSARFDQWLAALRAQELAIRGDLQILLGAGEGTIKIVGAAAGAQGHGLFLLRAYEGAAAGTPAGCESRDSKPGGGTQTRARGGTWVRNKRVDGPAGAVPMRGQNTRHGCAGRG